MTAFGQNIIPTIYEDNTFRAFSKAGFLSHLVRALQTVGMVPLTGLWPFDPIANPEFPIQEGNIYLFPFDFPDDGGTLTFNVSGTLWRPCVIALCGHGNEDLETNPTRLETTILVELCIRLDGAPSVDNMYAMARSRGGSAGLAGMGAPTSSHGSVYPNQQGHEVQKADWLPYAGSAAGNQATLPVGHWFAYLGPAGLHVYVGSNDNRPAFGDIMSWASIFSGARIPGRAKPVLEDSNLSRINPTIPMFWFTADGTEGGALGTAGRNFWDTGVSAFQSQIRPKIHRMQADLKFTAVPVDGWLFNLENVEYPFFPLYEPDTRPSPRVISGGGGGHILGRAVLVPDSLETDPTDKYGPILPELSASEVRPQFEDTFDCPGFRFCDVVAPIGLHTDPNTLLDWYLVPTYNSNQLVGLLQENGSIVGALASIILTAAGSDSYTMAPNGWAGPFPTSVTITETGTATGIWSDDPPNDRQMFSVPNLTGTKDYHVQWDIALSGSDPDDTLYQISYSAFNRDDPQGGSNPSEGENDLTFEYFFNASWIVVHTIECAGANTLFVNSEGELSYSAATYTAFVSKDPSIPTPQLTLRWHIQGEPFQTCDGEVTTIVVNKFRYL
jgi:hypothetical protein